MIFFTLYNMQLFDSISEFILVFSSLNLNSIFSAKMRYFKRFLKYSKLARRIFFYYLVLTLKVIFQILKDEKEKHRFIPELFMNVAVIYPAGNYMFKVNIRNTRTRCGICSKFTIKPHLVLVFLLLL